MEDAIVRVVIQHYCCDKHGVTPKDFAETAGVGGEPMRQYMLGDDDGLTSSERKRVSEFAAELIDSEKYEQDEARKWGRRAPHTVWDRLNEEFKKS